MTGEELRTKAISGARGFGNWNKLSAGEKGVWNGAALEVTHLEEKVAQLEEELHNANDHIHDMEHT